MKRTYSLDVLRIIATIMIVMHHYQQITNSYFAGQYNFRRFGVVVEFFFLLSGFLVYKYIEKKELKFTAFIKRKALRLLPLVILSSIVYEVLLFIYNEVCGTTWVLGNEISIWGVFLNAIGMQAGWVFENPGVNNPSWYVSVLLLCYVVFWILVWCSRKMNIPVGYFFAGMVVLGVIINISGIKLPFLNEYSTRGYYSFFSGLLLAGWLNGKEISYKWTIGALVVILAVAYVLNSRFELLGNGLAYILVFLLYPALVIFCLSKPISRLFDFRFIGFLGKSTYDMYLWHVPMMLAMYIVFKLFDINYNLDYYRCLLGFTAGTVIVGVISHILIDGPIQKVLQRKADTD